MKSNTLFVGLDVHKATVVAAVAEGKRDGAIRQIGTIPHRADQIRKLVEKLDRAARSCASAMKRARAATGFIASSPRWAMSASWWRRL